MERVQYSAQRRDMVDTNQGEPRFMTASDPATAAEHAAQSQSDPAERELEQYVEHIGKRIRAIRARRGMSRKLLSRHSSISERYLAQTETGKANISIALLWNISQALQVKLTDLLPEGETIESHSPLSNLVRCLSVKQQDIAYQLLQKHFSKPAGNCHGIALIGLRGAGKTRLGSLLADEFNVPFIRMGEVIEQLAGMNIGELFSLGGQKAYRRFEKQALEKILAEHPKAIVEAGGSLVSESETLRLLLDAYYTVWIKASAEEHMNRVLEQGDMRPMEGNKQAMDDLKLILLEREAEYQLANYTLDTSGRKVLDCLQELVTQSKPYLGHAVDIS